MERETDQALARWRAEPSAEAADALEIQSPLELKLPGWRAEELGVRLDALASSRADPRVTGALERWLLQDIPFAGARSVWRRVLCLVARMRDVRARRWLPAIVEEAWGPRWHKHWLTTRAHEVAPPLGVRAAPALPGGAARVPVFAGFRSESPGERRVWADRLLESGDPRGELLALQLAGGHRQRVKELVQLHGRHLAGGVAPALRPDQLGFEDGYLASGALVNTAALVAYAGHPDWATVRELDFLHVKACPAAGDFLTHACLLRLERVVRMSSAVFHRLLGERRPLQVRALELSGWLYEHSLARLHEHPAFERVESITCGNLAWTRPARTRG